MACQKRDGRDQCFTNVCIGKIIKIPLTKGVSHGNDH